MIDREVFPHQVRHEHFCFFGQEMMQQGIIGRVELERRCHLVEAIQSKPLADKGSHHTLTSCILKHAQDLTSHVLAVQRTPLCHFDQHIIRHG